MLIFAEEGGGGSATPPAAPDNAPAEPATTGTGLPINDPAGEGTTPEEVASVLKSSGINLPAEPTAIADDGEEGDDPDAPAAQDEPAAPPAAPEEPTPPEEPAEPAAPEEPAAPAEPETPPTPPAAEADPDKYTLTVEDATGTTYKIGPGDKLEEALANFEPKNNGQIMDILDQLRDLRAQQAQDQATEAENTAKAETAQRVADIRKGWDSEITDLKAQNRIVEGDEGQARINEVYKFMSEENDKRIAAGRPTIGSFEDALDKLEAQEGRNKAIEAAKAEKEEARNKGALVGGSSAAVATTPKPYVAGSARNANDAIRKMNLI